MKCSPPLGGFALIILTTGLVVSSIGSVQASTVACGDQIYSDIKLESNLYCEFTALSIGASGVTLDLNGYTIKGGVIDHGIIGSGHTDITIQNGAISGFMEGIGLYDVKNVRIKQITFENQGDDSIQVFDGQDIVISDIQTSLPLPNAGSSIALINNKNVDVTNLNATGGLYGLLSSDSVNFQVANSSFSNVRHLGIRIIKNLNSIVENNTVVGATGCFSGIDVVDRGPTTNVRIQNNVLTGCDRGIAIETFTAYPPSENITIRGNRMRANNDGILLIGLRDSTIERNRLHFNNVGIVLLGDSYNNRIIRNIATGNFVFDMYEEINDSNTWNNNTCLITNGAAIDCP
jgi:parallel beta-helix repeat protein